jgi:hypothetical protein
MNLLNTEGHRGHMITELTEETGKSTTRLEKVSSQEFEQLNNQAQIRTSTNPATDLAVRDLPTQHRLKESIQERLP